MTNNLDGDLTAWTQSATLGAPASPPAQRRWDLQYDALGELTDLKATLTGGASDEHRTRAYDAAGNMTSHGIELGTNRQMELRTHTGRNQLATIVASLLPIMWSTRTGAEVMKPLATPVIGGMLSSLIHILIVTPVIFVWLRTGELKGAEVR